MAIKIDNDLLQQLGLAGLPEAEKNSLLRHIYETLEMRVGVRLADQMTNEQLDEFEKYFDAKDDAGAFKWLESNFPNYKDIVQQEFDKLKAEIAQSAPQIMAASQQAAAQAPQQPQMQQQPVAAPQYTQQPSQPQQYQQQYQRPQPPAQPYVAPQQPQYQQPPMPPGQQGQQPPYAPPQPPAGPNPYQQPPQQS